MADIDHMKQIVIAKIKSYQAKGEALNISSVKDYDPDLMNAVYSIKPYWGWKQALKESGLSYDTIRQVAPDRVKCMICGEKMAHLGAHVRHVHKLLPSAYAARFPGEEMVAPSIKLDFVIPNEGNIEISNWEITWTREYFLDKVREYYLRGYSLCTSKIYKLDPPLLKWGSVYYESWMHALVAAGILPESVPAAERAANPERAALIMRVNQLYIVNRSGEYESFVYFYAHVPYSDYKQFESYEEMLIEAGIDPQKVRSLRQPNISYETKEEMLDHIYRRYQRGQTLGKRRGWDGKLSLDGVLTFACKKAFGEWTNALAEFEKVYGVDLNTAGLSRAQRKYPDKASVIRALKERIAKDISVRISDLKKGPTADYMLWEYMKIYFKSTADAYKAAGLNPLVYTRGVRKGYEKERAAFIERFPSKEATAKEILALAADRSLQRAVPGKKLGKSFDPMLRKAIYRYFGSVAKAMQELALKEPEVMHLSGPGSRKRYTTKEAVIAALQKRKSENMELSPRALMSGKENRDLALYLALKPLFGSSAAAYDAAGLDSDKLMRKFVYLDHDKIKTKEGLLEAMLDAYKRHQEAPKTKYLFWNLAIIKGAKELFGSIREAKIAAGIPCGRRKMTTEEKLQRRLKIEIRKRAERDLPMNPGALQNSKNAEDKKLFYSSCELFGSWKDALDAAGIDQDKKRV